MNVPMSAPLVVARALFAGTFAFWLGAAGHVMAQGLLPGPGLLATLYLVTVAISLPLLAKPSTVPRLLLLLVGGQAVIHLCLTLSAGHVGDPKVAALSPQPAVGLTGLPVINGRRVGSFQDAFAGSDAVPGAAPALPVPHLIADLSAHAPMMVAHFAAATLVALWLAYGERRAFAVLVVTARYALSLVRWTRALPARVRVARPILVEAVLTRLRDLLSRRSLARRGPPLLAA